MLTKGCCCDNICKRSREQTNRNEVRKTSKKSFEKSLTNHGECVKIAELLKRANKTEAKFEKLRKKFKKRLDKRNQV